MTSEWNATFKRRMNDFGRRRPSPPGALPVSVKVRVTSGCFHREHSPRAYALIDAYLDRLSPDDLDFQFEEHESGPEILIYVAAATVGITLAKSLIELVTAIIKARGEGIRQGDHPRDALTLIVRRTMKDGECHEEEVLRFESTDPIDSVEIEESLNQATKRLAADKPEKTANNASQRIAHPRRVRKR